MGSSKSELEPFAGIFVDDNPEWHVELSFPCQSAEQVTDTMVGKGSQ